MLTYPNNYQQSMMNMSNPYMDRYNQLQQFQQNLQGGNQNLQMLGKIVESEDIVKATDIPMDGNMYYFPKADGSMIFIGEVNIENEQIDASALEDLTSRLQNLTEKWLTRSLQLT